MSARTHGAISRYADGRWTRLGPKNGLDDQFVASIAFTPRGDLWVAGWKSLFLRRVGEPRLSPTAIAISTWADLAVDSSGATWLSDSQGVRRLPDPKTALEGAGAAVPTPHSDTDTPVLAGRRGVLWVATAGGLGRLRPGANALEVFGAKDGLTGDSTRTVMEDREGDLWVGTSLGLDRFRPARVTREPAVPVTPAQGYRVANDRSGAMFIANGDSLFRAPPGGPPELVRAGLDQPRALCDGASGMWLMTDGGLWRLLHNALASVPTPKDMGNAFGCVEDRYGALWVPAGANGLHRYADGRWRDLKMPGIDLDDHPPGRVTLDAHGRVLLFLEGLGIARIDGLRFSIPWRFDDLPIGHPILMTASGEDVLVGGQYGLARLRAGKVAVLSSDRLPWLRNVSGIAQSPTGVTWLVSGGGVSRLSSRALDAAFDDPSVVPTSERFELADGIPGPMNTGAGRGGALGGDGRFWFHGEEGVAFVDPARLERNSLPPPVLISAIATGGIRRNATSGLVLPSGASNLQIDYTAGSLSIPERVRFRYRLEDVDADWVDPGERRQAFYTRLGPGSYRFRVIAANDAGVWNRQGATFTFRIPPTFVQTRLFAGFCALLGAALLWFLYTLRLRQVADQVQARLQERTAERERIARELHDTLLQSVQGLILRFQAALGALPFSHAGKRDLERVLDQADAVLAQSRERVSDLRASDASDLAAALGACAARLTADAGLDVDVIEEGQRRNLQPLAHEECLRVAEEAMLNFVRHARASQLRVGLSYRSKALVLTILDNGVGIDGDLAVRGRSGHFGLTGMRERALRLGGEVSIQTREGGGTEVRLVAPAAAVYADARISGARDLWRRLRTPL